MTAVFTRPEMVLQLKILWKYFFVKMVNFISCKKWEKMGNSLKKSYLFRDLQFCRWHENNEMKLRHITMLFAMKIIGFEISWVPFFTLWTVWSLTFVQFLVFVVIFLLNYRLLSRSADLVLRSFSFISVNWEKRRLGQFSCQKNHNKEIKFSRAKK